MNKKWMISGIIAGCFIAYLIMINLVSSIASINLNSEAIRNEQSFEGSQVQIGIGDSIDVTIQRNRWYGKILESSEKSGSTSRLYLLGFISLPLRSNGTNLFFWHLIFIAGFSTLGYYLISKINRSHFERGYY